MKKIIITLLTFMLIGSSCLMISPFSSKAYWDRDYAINVTIDGITYTAESGYAEDEEVPIEKEVYYVDRFEQSYDEQGNPLYTDIVIQDEINGFPVVGIYTDDFNNHKEITSVKLSKNMLFVQGFSGCTGLTEIQLPEKIEQVGGFNDCIGLTEIVLPKGVKKVGGFSRCINLKEIILPPSVECVGQSAFQGCTKIKKIVFPKSVNTIFHNAFEGCTSLEEIIFESTTPERILIYEYAFYNTPLVNRAQAKGEALVLEGGFLLNGSGMKGNVELTGDNINSVASCAFYGNKNIREVKIKDVSYIGQSAFERSGIIKLIVDNTEYIGDRAFREAKKLKKASLKKVNKIGRYMFKNCKKMKECKISGVKTISEGTFDDCVKLKKVIMGKETKTIGAGCFYQCKSLEKLIIKSKKKIVWKTREVKYADKGDVIFYKCKKLKKITLKSKKISSTIKKVKFPKGVKLDVPNGARAKYRKYVDCKVI